MKLIGEFFSLFFLFFVVKIRALQEERKVKKRFYKKADFKICDLFFKKLYRFQNPYKVSKKFMQKKGALDIYVYGETPLTTLEQIIHMCGIHPKDVFFDLGCGRGRTVFFLSQFYGIKALGVEMIPEFVYNAEILAKKLLLHKASFVLGDMLSISLKEATIVYLYGSCLPDEMIYSLKSKFTELAKGVKVITVSFSLSDYGFSSFILKKQFEGRFPWGTTNIYLQEKIF